MLPLTDLLQRHHADFHPVVPFDAVRERLYPFDFTERNTELSPATIADTDRFADWIRSKLQQANARYGIGGYGEHRTLYARSRHFGPSAETRQLAAGQGGEPRGLHGDQEAEPRRLHLGLDIWGAVGTKVMAPFGGIVHSFAFNNNDSDYGATIVLTHQLEGVSFHTLYGHLSLNSLKNLYEGQRVAIGEVIGEFGMRFENGNWPPHLHLQCIADMQGWKGDYPGVCRYSERQQWLDNCPDPDLIVQLNHFSLAGATQ